MHLKTCHLSGKRRFESLRSVDLTSSHRHLLCRLLLSLPLSLLPLLLNVNVLRLNPLKLESLMFDVKDDFLSRPLVSPVSNALMLLFINGFDKLSHKFNNMVQPTPIMP